MSKKTGRSSGNKTAVSWTIDAEICEKLLEIEIQTGIGPCSFVNNALRSKLGLPPKEIPNADK